MANARKGSHVTVGERASRIAAIEEELTQHDINKVQIGGFDVDGVMRGKYVSTQKFLSAARDGFSFCDVIFGWDCADSVYDCGTFTGWHTGFPDTQARLDLDTFRLVPWEPRTAFCLGDFYRADGAPLPICPRQTLKRIIARAGEMGYVPRMAAEYEFFLFEETSESVDAKGYRCLKPESPGMFCYSLLRASARSEFVDLLFESLNAFGIHIEGLHTETGPGAFETCIYYDTALEAADAAGLFKLVVKQLAARKGLLATFMAKWNADMPGSGGHIHQSLWNAVTGENAFAAPAEGEAEPRAACSEIVRQYIAGQQQVLTDMIPLVCPTINSYRRLVPGYWAPTTATWGVENRTSALRLIPGTSPKATRVETRVVGADASPHLAMAACLASGLHGIRNGLQPTDPITGNAYADRGAPELPHDLLSATLRMKESPVAREWLGDEFVDHYCITREWECREFAKAVTDWELRRYLETV
jgi:glutamine synthetase